MYLSFMHLVHSNNFICHLYLIVLHVHIVFFEAEMRRRLDIRAGIEGSVDVGEHVAILFAVVCFPCKRAYGILQDFIRFDLREGVV